MCPCWVWTWIVFVATLVLFGVLVWHRRPLIEEAFADQEGPPPDLNKMLGRVQGLLDKIATPEVLAHMTTVMNKDPGELARMYSDQQKQKK
jgi:hypothetical protein